jgi:hypothetical protein
MNYSENFKPMNQPPGLPAAAVTVIQKRENFILILKPRFHHYLQGVFAQEKFGRRISPASIGSKGCFWKFWKRRPMAEGHL